MSDFQKAYEQLNTNQRIAVDTIDGPLLVIAGPGTGKTQLLSARVAKILQVTDTLPQNILCLTFTETGAANMRERLSRFIGQMAYDVQISTYHAFGGDLIQRYPEYFPGLRLLNPIDELGQYQILKTIVDGMSYKNPLKQTQHHINDLISTISEIKRALLTPKELRAIAKENNAFIAAATELSRTILHGMKSTASYKAVHPLFSQLSSELDSISSSNCTVPRFSSLSEQATSELRDALAVAEETQKTSAITAWKNNWLIKDVDNQYVFDGELQNERIQALAKVSEQYAASLEAQNLYDFDDMILRSITALETYSDFKYTLQERYQYLLLDEYQDTNAAQARLIALLTDSPVHEGRPNIMAVGDDDQAIYAFQGARYSNMLDFYKQYRDTVVVNLTNNYRSHADVLTTARAVADQIGERLHHNFVDMSKTLVAAGKQQSSQIARTEFISDIAQYHWIAETIADLIAKGTNPREIAVLAPRHKYLEPLVGYLNQHTVPVRYDKRENILETSIIQQIVAIARLLIALNKGDDRMSNAFWPQVLSYEFWGIPISTIWQLSWQANDRHSQWAQLALEQEATKSVALLLLTIASRAETETCEALLDYIIGTESVQTNEPDTPTATSPLRAYYTSEAVQEAQPELFYETLSHLTVLREKLRERRYIQEGPLLLQDLIDMIDLYESAGQRMLDTSPYSQAADAVQLMTVYKSKGLEFEHVFIVNCHDDVWGSTSLASANRITLPNNLRPIRKAGTTDDERLRILFVALTRAKLGLHLTSFKYSFAGKPTRSLKYFDEQEQTDGSRKIMILPEPNQKIITNPLEKPPIEMLTVNWQQRHIGNFPDTQLSQLLQTRIANYQLSPTHLNQFTDVIYGGPQKFFMNSILRFPQAPTLSSQYGSIMHETLEWVQRQVTELTELPSEPATLKYFAAAMNKASLTKDQIELEIERGTYALTAYLKHRKSMFKPGNVPEHNFRNEGVFVGDVHLGGKVDLLEINHEDKTICVVDYKTGSWYTSWKNDAKLHKYKQQLFAYKVLVEGSNRFKGYTVTKGRLEFVEPDGQGKIYSLDLDLHDKETEIQRLKHLMHAMWSSVKALDLPNIDAYSKDLKGIQAFEDDLIKK